MSQSLLKILADFDTQLAAPVAAGDTTATLVSATDDDNVALPAGIYGFTIDNGNSAKEFFVCSLNSTALTSIVSISRQGVASAGFARAHRRGAKVIISDWAELDRIVKLLNGTTDFDAGTPLGYDGTASITSANQFATKAYVDATATGGATYDQQVIAGVAGETLSAGNLVYFKESDQRWWLTDADTASTVQGVLLGFAQAAGVAGNVVSILRSGLEKNQSGMTPGSKYYAGNTAGAISSSIGTTEVYVGNADSATDLIVDFRWQDMPTALQKAALAGTSGSPSLTNKYVTQNDTTNGATQTGTTISFTATSTISDSGNGFVTSGFQVGQTITVSGSGSNDGTYTITAVAAGAITVAETSIVNESAGASVTITAASIGKVLRLSSTGQLPSNITIDISQISGGSVGTFTLGETITAGDSVFVSDGTEIVQIIQTTENANSSTYGANWFGQTFTTGSGVTKIRSVSLAMQRTNSPAGNVVVSLYATSGGLPTGAALYTATLTATSVGTTGNLTNTFTLNATVTPSTVYAIVVSVPSGDVTNHIDLDHSTSSTYADGTYLSSTNSGSTWSADANKDLVFQVEQMFTAGYVYQSSASSGRANFTGIALESGTSGQSKKVQMKTGVYTSSGLTAGQYFMSDTAGAISTSAGTVPIVIGQAYSATKLVIDGRIFAGTSYTVSPSIWMEAATSFMIGFLAPCDGTLVNYFTNDTGSGTEATVQRSADLQFSSPVTLAYMKMSSAVDGNTLTVPIKKGYYYRVLYVGTPTGGTSKFFAS